VAEVRDALLGSDETLIRECLPRLERAIVVMQEIRATSQDRRALATLRRDLAVVTGLARSGETLCHGLARLLGAAAGGYTPQGDGAPLHPSATLLVRG
jgi:hypothetical protein